MLEKTYFSNFDHNPILYAHIKIVVSFLLVKLFSVWVITSCGAGVSSSNFVRNYLLGLLYLPEPDSKALDPSLFSRKQLQKNDKMLNDY